MKTRTIKEEPILTVRKPYNGYDLEIFAADLKVAEVGKKWETENMRLTYIDPTTKETFDSKRFKEEHPESYKKYIKTTKVKSSIRITAL